MTTSSTFRHWIDLSENNIRSLLIALVGLNFGPEPEKHIPEIRESRKDFANYVADQARIDGNDVVLDLGSGCGFGTYWFAQRAKHVHACDISPAYLSFAARECSALHNVSST
ncbi:MAG: class I SAM-dependent methyltransferase [Candidatus Korobacteraceae bacterium]